MKPWICLASLMLSACAAGSGSYGLDHGVASYDNLQSATERCQAEGGNIVLKNGYDNRELSNYQCRIGGAK